MSEAPAKHSKNWLEWLVFGASCLVVVWLVATIAHYGFVMKEGPAVLHVEVGKPVVGDDFVTLPVTVANQGGSVATNVRVLVTGVDQNGQDCESEFTLDFVPRGAERVGAVWFEGRDVPGDLRVEAAGYEEP